jgi:WhiB family transcriptional regulator, redox-sensing transcriptional regulator
MRSQPTTRQQDEVRAEVEGLGKSPHWQRRAACRASVPALFFPPGNSHLARADEERAKAMCGSCPVRAPCLALAIEHEETHGVWGGLNTEERRALKTAGATA